MTTPAPLQLLLLEDSEADVLLIQRQFVKQGVACEWRLAESAEQFREALAQGAVDAVISDMLIPGFGAETALEILATRPGPNPPLVVISGLIGEEVAVEMMKAGAKDFLVKSNLKRLVSVVLRAIREARLERIEEQSRRQAERAVRDRERLLEIVSHDLKNPLGAMTLNLQLLGENLGTRTEGDRNHVLLERIRKSVVRVDRLIRDVLDQAKIEAGKFVISPHRTSVHELMADLHDVFAPIAQSRDVSLHFDVRLQSDEQTFDGERIHQVLSNLISNAIKFTAVGSDVQIVASENERGLRFAVADEGPGIPEPERELVFTKFWQAPDRQKFGTGLGLSIAREIVRGHEGEIGVSSPPGKGSEFWFEIPHLPEETSLESVAELGPDQKLTILLLEDDEDLREVMDETLRNDRTEVTSMAFGAQAMEALQQGLKPQLLIVDHDLPGMTGGEFLRRAFAQNLIPKDARVVLTSAHPDLKDRAVALGLTLTLQKPFTLRRLVDQVESWRRPRVAPLQILGAPEAPVLERIP
ncbi:MAG: response regulator [Bdellovibrionaceae bacterium]|nr:response regulator [Pseudobdellovibrionaceae bacterium]